MEASITCPKCGHSFELTEALAAPLVASAKAAAESAAAIKIEAARIVFEKEATLKAASLVSTELTIAKQTAAEATQREQAMSASLAIAQNEQAKALRAQREFEDAKRELELTIEKRTAQGLDAVKQTAERAAEERLGSKLQEKELAMESLARTVEDLRRKLEQGSQQAQGEVQEIVLEASLRERFPTDAIIPVGKGVSGGDCVHTVPNAGVILYESKNTKAWSDGWLAKLRDDGRNAKADLLVIVTVVLPKGIESFGQVEGVWVCTPRYVIALAVVLRQVLTEVAAAKAAGEGVETKAGHVYQYMVGPRFKSRVAAIVEAFTSMREDLDAERRAITKQWSKREAQIERVLQGTVGMYGDLQAIAGKSLAEIEGLDLARLPGT